MRLWHYQMIPNLPSKMLVSQWRECIAIKRQWEKGSLTHPLVGYVKNHSKEYFLNYVVVVTTEMDRRGIKYKSNLYDEIVDFCTKDIDLENCRELRYPEHNRRYYKQCYYNLQEKYNRGIITQDEWAQIEIPEKKYKLVTFFLCIIVGLSATLTMYVLQNEQLQKENKTLKDEVIEFKWQLEQVPYIIESTCKGGE